MFIRVITIDSVINAEVFIVLVSGSNKPEVNELIKQPQEDIKTKHKKYIFLALKQPIINFVIIIVIDVDEIHLFLTWDSKKIRRSDMGGMENVVN